MLCASLPAVRKGKKTILHPCEIRAGAGEVLGVIGPNGAGKSTLLQGLAHAGAALTWNGVPLLQRQIGYMPQAFQAPVRMAVLDCVLLGRREGLGWRVAPADLGACTAALARLGLASLADRPLDSLSGGQQQMVLLAQRLVREPRLMVLDEPTSALDLHHQLTILDQVRSYARGAGACVVMALHDLTMAARFCDRLILLHQARIIGTDLSDRMLTAEKIGQAWGIRPEILHSHEGLPVVVPHPIGARE